MSSLGLQLVFAVGVGMQEADGDGRTAGIQQLLGGRLELVLVERRQHLAGVERPFLDAQAKVTRHQRLVRLDEHVEHRPVEVSDAPPDLQLVAESLGGDHAHLGAALGDQDIGAERRPVDDLLDLADELVDALPVVAGRLADRIEKTARRIVGCGRGLEPLQLPCLFENKTVGEGPAYVDGQLFHRIYSPGPPAGLISMSRVSSLMTPSQRSAGGTDRSLPVAASSTASVTGSSTTP